MTFELRLRPEGELDLEEAALWYEQQRASLGHQFLGFFGKMRTCPSGFRFARGFPQSRTLEVSRNR